MKFIKILNLKIAFYLALIITIFSYFFHTGVSSKNETDFLISMLAVIVLSVVVVTEIKGKMQSKNE